MTSSRRVVLVWRWSVSAMLLTALFWGIWDLVTGSVPVVTSLQITPDTAYELPLAVSRWFDVLFAGVWTALIVLVVTSESSRNDSGLVAGLGFGLFVGLTYGLGYGLGFGLAFGLAACLAFGLVVGPFVGLGYGLGYGLTYGLGYGLGFGLAFGLAACLAFGLTACLAFGLTASLRHLFRKKTWYSIRDWYLAR